ncbi:MAG: DUF5007 domain-containing protein [Niabella sp.]|nr:DUF5007 domain-containing protein [Niabella sp.]
MKINLKIFLFLLSIGMLGAASCVKRYLPEERVQFSHSNAQYISTTFTPTLGRPYLTDVSNFNFTGSTQPLTFKILNARTLSGDPAPEITTDVYPVKVWKQQYTGLETSLKEIEDKRTVEPHHLFEVRPNSGQFLMWPEASSKIFRSQPDSGYVFDVQVGNSGGSKYISGLRLKPLKERPYEPSNIDPVTGQATVPYVRNNLTFTNVVGEAGATFVDGVVFFRRKGDGNSLTFKFLDTAQHFINPNKFKLTQWTTLVHGFDMKLSDTAASYTVAYPVPLIDQFPTKYTNPAGTLAHVVFAWSRIGFGQQFFNCSIAFDFKIYQPGDWEVIFWFRNDNPKFSDG